MSQCASPSERCFVHVVIQQLFSIPRELWSKVSTVVVVNKQIPLDRYGVQGMYSHLTRHMQREKWIIHMILAISFLAQHEHLHVTVIWWSVLNDSLVSYFPRGNHEEFLPPDKPFPVCRTETRWNELGNTSATWIYRNPQDQVGCIQECWGGWLAPFQGFSKLFEKLLL